MAWEFTITVVGNGHDEDSAWADAKESAARMVENDKYIRSEDLGDDEIDRGDDEDEDDDFDLDNYDEDEDDLDDDDLDDLDDDSSDFDPDDDDDIDWDDD